MTFAWLDLGDGRQVYRRIVESGEAARSHLPCPQVISDTMPDAEHPCDGKFYSSKSAFRRVTKAHGMIEVGNEKPKFEPRRPDRKAIRDTLRKAVARHSA